MRSFKLFLATMATALLASCGGGSSGCNAFNDPTCSGGSGTGGGGTTDPAASTLSVALSSTTVSAATPATVTATVRTAAGAGIEGVVVGFTTANGLGGFSATSGLTNAAGQATVSLLPNDVSVAGADEVVATSLVNGTELTARAGFQLSATQVDIATFTADIVGADTLGAGGQATLTATLTGVAAGTPVNVAVTSTCVTAGKATLTPASVSTTNGVATFTYVNTECGSVDGAPTTDTVQATIVGGTASETVTLPIAPRNAASIAFLSASPERIFIKGSGYEEVAFVTFEVRDEQGRSIPGQEVALEPTTLSGGLTLDGGSNAVTKVSDSNGIVTVRVNSGTVPTPVRVRATLGASGITTVSSNLAVAVGLPSQLNFSLSQETLNIEGFNIDGTDNSYTIIASDRLGNPVPAGTTINFIVEGGGQIDTARQIVIGGNGLASTTAAYQSSEPRPADGRITVVAYALGEESFLDVNGNNVWDSTEDFMDLGDVFISRPYTSTFSSSIDQRIPLSGADTSASCVANTSPLLDNGVDIPSDDATCSGTWSNSIYVRRAAETVLSTSGASPKWGRTYPSTLDNTCAGPVTIVDDTRNSVGYYPMVGGLQGAGAAGSFSFLVSDRNPNRLNPMPAGTVISVSSTSGLTTRVLSGSPVPNTLSATFASIRYEFADDTTSGTATVNITSPGGLTTSISVPIDSAAGTPCAR